VHLVGFYYKKLKDCNNKSRQNGTGLILGFEIKKFNKESFSAFINTE